MTGGVIIAAPSSGSGKTLVTLGLARAFVRQGLSVQCFKSGPDYIDPAFHRAATGRASFNLDSWAMGQGQVAGLLSKADGADIVIAEGAMGLHDGVAKPGEFGHGASADLALHLDWPVVLVIDAGGQAQTAGAVALGLQQYRAGLRLAGVILNKVASPRHERLLRAGMAQAGIAVLGALPKLASVALPERHLGLVQAEELPELEAILNAAADLVSAHVDLDAIRAAAGVLRFGPMPQITPPGQRIALARDAAFSFIYPHLIDGWRAAGAEVVTFSPLADEAPPVAGYPELHAGVLASADKFRAECSALLALFTANVAGIWCWAKAWWIRQACGIRCWGCWGWSPVLNAARCIWATAWRLCLSPCRGRVRARACAGMSFTIPPS